MVGVVIVGRSYEGLKKSLVAIQSVNLAKTKFKTIRPLLLCILARSILTLRAFHSRATIQRKPSYNNVPAAGQLEEFQLTVALPHYRSFA